MILQSALPFIAIALFLMALLFRRKESDDVFYSSWFGKLVGALGWVSFACYCYFETLRCLLLEDYVRTSFALIFLAFSLLLALLLMTTSEKGDADLVLTITKVALITAVFYFPFSEFALLGDLLIFVTAKLSVMMLNLLNVGVYMVPPSSIYSTSSSFHEVYKPIEIILACTAIQSMALFMGVVFGVTAPIGRKLKAFCVSVPVIYGLNILRNALVGAAYFEQWFGSPLHSFFIAHEVLARIGSMIALIAIAYAVFVILPEALDLIEDLFRFIKTTFSTRIKG
jgi:archaeosortase A (PGF-CTERM-specific)